MKQEKITVRVSIDTKEKIQCIVKDTGKSQSQVVNELLAKGLVNSDEVILKKDLAPHLVCIINHVNSAERNINWRKNIMEEVNQIYGHFNSES